MFIKLILAFIFNLIIMMNGKLIFSDEFNDVAGTLPSKDNWNYDLGDGSSRGIPGWGNGELQYYTNSSKNSATDGEGNLVITAIRDNNNYSNFDCFYGTCTFTSARLVSKFAQTYGRFEARVKTPAGKGVWPAFWMLGQNIKNVSWPACGEIDIMELRGSEPNKVSGAIHGPGFSGGESISWKYTSKNMAFDEDFHVIAVIWTPDSLKWLVDDEVYAIFKSSDLGEGKTWVFNAPFQMLLNLAIGGNFDGYPVKNETFPKMFYVDYVRVYDLEDQYSVHMALPNADESVGSKSSGLKIFNYFQLTFYASTLSIIVGLCFKIFNLNF